VLHKEIPFLRILIPLCAGIISGVFIEPDNAILISALLIIIAGFTSSLLFNRYIVNLVFGCTVSFSFFICGLLLYSSEKKRISILDPERACFGCTVEDFPEERENSCRLTVRLNRRITPSGNIKISGSMLLYIKKRVTPLSFTPGDRLIINCIPVAITNRGNPCEFDYRFYMENHSIRYYAFPGQDDIAFHAIPGNKNLAHRALIIRERIIEMYEERGITGRRLALVAAIILGRKNLLDPSQKQNFMEAGIMHIMAVSGLHAGIISLFIFNILFFLRNRFNVVRILITILFLWLFAFVTGLTPSVLRATLMFSFLHAGKIMRRPVNGINSVLASGFVLIILRPSVIFDAGFLLSYSAVIYIIMFYGDLYHRIIFSNRFADKIWQSAVVTIVAQAGTFPLTVLLFNRFPTYFILTNIIIVPLSSLLIITGCLVPLLFPLRFLSRLLALVTGALADLTELLTAKAAGLPFSTIENIGMTTIECIILAVFIFLFSVYLLKGRPFSVLYPLIFLLLLVSAGTAREIMVRSTGELIVYNSPGTSAIGIRNGRILNLYSAPSLPADDIKRYISTLRLKVNNKALSGDRMIIAGEKQILICSNLNNKLLMNCNPDFIILTGARPGIEGNLPLNKLPARIIITSETGTGLKTSGHIKPGIMEKIHYVKRSGAFICHF
jgi:competence protein ComEC